MFSTKTAYFEPGREPQILDLTGRRLGRDICEDVWNDRDFWQRPRYHQDPISTALRCRRRGRSKSFRLSVHHGQATAAGEECGA